MAEGFPAPDKHASKRRELQPGIPDVLTAENPGAVIELFDTFSWPKTAAALGREFDLNLDGSNEPIGFEFG